MPSLAENDTHSNYNSQPASAPADANAAAEQQAFAESSQKPEKKSAAQQLVEIAQEVYNFGVDTDGKPFGVRKGGHVVRMLVNGRFSLRKELGGLYYKIVGRPASQNALTEAIGVLEYVADQQGEPVELALRAARPTDDMIYIDMGDKDERVLRISAAGWEVLDGNAEIPVLFRRTNLTAALPTPLLGGDLEQLWQFVNMNSANDRQVLRGWLVSAYALVGRLGRPPLPDSGAARRAGYR